MSGSTRTPGEQTRPLPWQLDLGVSARVLTGITPQPAVGPGLAVLAQWGALALHVGSSWLPSRTYSARPALRISGHLAELGVCGRGAGVSQLLALFCVDMWAGALRASADPLQQPSPRWDGLLLLVPRVTGRFQLARSLGVAVGLGAAIPLILPRYAYGNTSGERVVAHTPELGVFFELALWLRIHP
jgi:hypothetical protein